MVSLQVSIWIVTIFGWVTLIAAIAGVLYWLADRVLRLLGVIGWMMATYQQVRKDHDWVDERCPLWWHWAAGFINSKR